MHSNHARINKTVEILHGTLLSHNSNQSCWLYTWELSNSSNKLATNLNTKGVSFFIHPVAENLYAFIEMCYAKITQNRLIRELN